MNETNIGVRVGATPEPLTHLLIAIDDDRRAHLTYCAGRGAIVDAVVIATYGEPTLDQDAREEAAGITDALLEDGIFRFEGDPPLHLFELVPGAALRAPEPLTALPHETFIQAMQRLHPGFVRAYSNEFLSFAQKGWSARAALEGGVSRTEPVLTDLQIEMDLWPRLRLGGMAISLHECLTVMHTVRSLIATKGQT